MVKSDELDVDDDELRSSKDVFMISSRNNCVMPNMMSKQDVHRSTTAWWRMNRLT